MLLLEIKIIKKLETTYFGLTVAIIRFHLEKVFVRFVTQLCKRALVFSTHHSHVWLDIVNLKSCS